MNVRLIDTSRYDGMIVEVKDLRPVLELPQAEEFVAAEESVKAGQAYRGANTRFHLRLKPGGEQVYIAEHLLALHGG